MVANLKIHRNVQTICLLAQVMLTWRSVLAIFLLPLLIKTYIYNGGLLRSQNLSTSLLKTHYRVRYIGDKLMHTQNIMMMTSMEATYGSMQMAKQQSGFKHLQHTACFNGFRTHTSICASAVESDFFNVRKHSISPKQAFTSMLDVGGNQYSQFFQTSRYPPIPLPLTLCLPPLRLQAPLMLQRHRPQQQHREQLPQ